MSLNACCFDGCTRGIVNGLTGLCKGHQWQRDNQWPELRPIGERWLTPSFCEFDGCEYGVWAHGLCRAHLHQSQEGKSLAPVQRRKKSRPVCGVPDCDWPTVAKQRCRLHRKLGDDAVPGSRLAQTGQCTVCSSAVHVAGLCVVHYKQKTSYGAMHPGGIEAIHAEHTGECHSCGDNRPDLVIDHDHKTKAYRGWLCPPCNKAEGLLKTADRATSLAAYIITHSKESSDVMQ